MKRSYAVAAVVAAVIVGILLLRDSLAQSPSPAAAPAARVAVCDVQQIFTGYNKATDLLAKLNDKRQALAAELEQRSKAIESLQQEMDALKKGSSEYQSRLAEVERLRIDLAVSRQFGEAKILAEHRQLTMEMYDEMVSAISQVAKDRGVEVVLHADRGLMETDETMELLAQIRVRTVLYWEPSLDITQEVLARLNKAYTASAR